MPTSSCSKWSSIHVNISRTREDDFDEARASQEYFALEGNLGILGVFWWLQKHGQRNPRQHRPAIETTFEDYWHTSACYIHMIGSVIEYASWIGSRDFSSVHTWTPSRLLEAITYFISHLSYMKRLKHSTGSVTRAFLSDSPEFQLYLDFCWYRKIRQIIKQTPKVVSVDSDVLLHSESRNGGR